MRAGTHAVLFAVLVWTSTIAYVGAAVAACALSLNVLHMLVPLGIFGLAWATIWYMPVQCSQPGCSGRMRKNYEFISCARDRIQYECADCKYVYQKGFASLFLRFTVTVES